MTYILTFAAKMMKKWPQVLINQGLETFDLCQKVVAYHLIFSQLLKFFLFPQEFLFSVKNQFQKFSLYPSGCHRNNQKDNSFTAAEYIPHFSGFQASG